MKARIQKWGNSLALWIPQPLAAEMSVSQNSMVELSISEGNLVISPVTPAAAVLEELLQHVTADNLHSETDTGPSVGSEVW